MQAVACHQEMCQTSVELEPAVAVDQPLKECNNIKCTTADTFMLSYFHHKCFRLSMIYVILAFFPRNFKLVHLMPINFLDPLSLLNTKIKSVKIHCFIIIVTLIVFV